MEEEKRKEEKGRREGEGMKEKGKKGKRWGERERGKESASERQKLLSLAPFRRRGRHREP